MQVLNLLKYLLWKCFIKEEMHISQTSRLNTAARVVNVSRRVVCLPQKLHREPFEVTHGFIVKCCQV